MGESIRGRGASSNPANRFIPIYYEDDPARVDPDGPAPHTQLFRDQSRSIVATNDSPDVGFTHSINPYRGCEHGCSYCYARPFHEYLGFSAGLDFETKIMVKEDAPELLRQELLKPSWRPVTVALSGVTDCYQPIERRLQLTRRCLQALNEFRNPAGIVTKSQLVARDVDILAEMASYQASSVFISITTLDGELARKMEPRATQPAGRLAAMETLAKAGVPVGVMVAPIIPGLNDHEVPSILQAVRDAGGRFAGYTILRLPLAVAEIFTNWLEQHFPERKDKVLNRLRELRGGKLNEARFGSRMRGQGLWAKLFHDLFVLHRDRVGIARHPPELSTAHFRRPGERNLFAEMQ
ncbi:MAG TPA: PA0069 family radical SAM protein [Gemmataceae bacterium]|jgi:DNA repair photolyase|nr:PA0069 family radical SAM protein [Gemmataceae bacterium]